MESPVQYLHLFVAEVHLAKITYIHRLCLSTGKVSSFYSDHLVIRPDLTI